MPKISQYNPATTPLSGGETFILNQNGVTFNVTLSSIKNYTDTTLGALSSNYARTTVNNNFTTGQTIFGSLTASSVVLSGSPLIFRSLGTSSIGITDTVLTSVTNSHFIGQGAGRNATNANRSTFIGLSAGAGATNAVNATYIGYDSGCSATDAFNSNFIGPSTGFEAVSAYDSVFIGNGAGSYATNANTSVFIGAETGSYATNANNSNFIGNAAGIAATDAYNSIFIGQHAGYGALNATGSNFIGRNAGYSATDAINSVFIGSFAGEAATTASDSVFIGSNSGYGVTGYRNILIGAETSLETPTLSGCLALGYGATVTENSTIVLGSAESSFLTEPIGAETESEFLIVWINGNRKKIKLYEQP